MAFDPNAHLTVLRGRGGAANYLEVKWRLAWLRDVHPDAVIETTPYAIDHEVAIVMAKVTVPTGGSATGIGSESKGDFGDYIEKAETKAIGRALAALGFGTQFCDDFDTPVTAAGQQRIVDAPVERPAAAPARPAPVPPAERSKPMNQSGHAPINQPTEKQLWLVRKLIQEAGFTEAAAISVMPGYDEPDAPTAVAMLDKFEVSKLIETLKEGQQLVPVKPTQPALDQEPSPFDGAPEPVEPDDEVPF